jgi:hypothetical protein
MKDVLVICYSFPPNPGVGGRRWAKFAKYLSKKDYRVHVVSNFNTTSAVSEWIGDVKAPNIINYPQHVFYPGVYISNPKTLIEKLQYRFWLFFFKAVSKGGLYDRSFFWKKTILSRVKKIIIENNIKNVVVSGPPFRLFYFMAILKKELKNINLIIDFRDPWTDNTSFLGFDSLSEKRMAYEKMMEQEAVAQANHVISANDYLTQIFKGKYPASAQKFSTIINGYDSDENPVSAKSDTKSGRITFVLAGTLYPDLEYLFVPFLNYLKDLKTNNPALFGRLSFDFYGKVDGKLEKLIKQHQMECFHLHGFQKLALVKQKLADADYCMLFTAPNHASNFNTKFYECISIKKPIVHFSNNGAISRFLIENHLGYAIRPGTLKEDMDKLLMEAESKEMLFNENFNAQIFNVEFLTAEFEKLLI